MTLKVLNPTLSYITNDLENAVKFFKEAVLSIPDEILDLQSEVDNANAAAGKKKNKKKQSSENANADESADGGSGNQADNADNDNSPCAFEMKGRMLVHLANCHLAVTQPYSAHKIANQAVQTLLAGGCCCLEARLIRARSICYMERRDEM
jgi:hypothetical protein